MRAGRSLFHYYYPLFTVVFACKKGYETPMDNEAKNVLNFGAELRTLVSKMVDVIDKALIADPEGLSAKSALQELKSLLRQDDLYVSYYPLG